MKTYLYIFLFLFISGIVSAQSSKYSKNGIYRWTKPVLLTPSDIRGAATGGRPIENNPGQRFAVIDVINDNKTAVIRILDYTNNILEFKKYNVISSAASKYTGKPEESRPSEDQAYFTVPVEAIEQLAVGDNTIAGGLALG
ncbi:hypothetical protein [Spirosoma koreense]